MEHLFKLLNSLYSDREWLIRITYEKNKSQVTEGYATEYLLYIEDRESAYFDSYESLEDYIYDLYKNKAISDAEDIINGSYNDQLDKESESDEEDHN